MSGFCAEVGSFQGSKPSGSVIPRLESIEEHKSWAWYQWETDNPFQNSGVVGPGKTKRVDARTGVGATNKPLHVGSDSECAWWCDRGRAGLLKSFRRLSGFGPVGCQSGISLSNTLAWYRWLRRLPAGVVRLSGSLLFQKSICVSTGAAETYYPFQHSGVVLRRNVNWFRAGFVFKAHRFLYHPTVGSRVI